MKRKTILMVLLFASIIGSTLSTRLVGVAEGSVASVETIGYQKLWGYECDSFGGDVMVSPVYAEGIRLSDGVKGGWANYWFYMPVGVFTFLDVGVYGKDSGIWGDGADVYVKNWASNSWDYVGSTGKTEGLHVFTVDPANHTSPLTYSYVIRVYAGPDDRYDLWYVDTEYDWVPEADTVLEFSFQPNPTNPGDTVELVGTLTDEYGNPIYWADVEVEYSTNGGITWHYIWTLDTYPLGEFSRTFPAPGAGEYLVRVSYAGSAICNPSSATETLIVQEAWGDYHFRINPWIDVMHIKISGNVIYGIEEVEGFYYDQPVLGWIEGSTFYVFIDFQESPYELMMLVGSTSTLSGNAYRTTDGTSWVGPTSISLTSVSPSSSELSTTGQAAASTVEPESWPPTYHFQLSPFVDVVHLGLDGSVLHGQCDAFSYQDQPVLGYVNANFFIFSVDLPGHFNELSITVGSVSTMSGTMYMTPDGKSVVEPTAITLIPAPP